MVPREDGSESRRNRDRLAGDGPLSIPTTDPLPRLEKSGDVAQWSRELVTRLEKNLGTLSLPQSTIVLTNGGNNNVNLQKGLLVRITGPTAPFNITGIGNGTTGQVIILENDSGQPLVLNNENASSQITNRINTGSGTDVTVNGSALLVYLQTRWRVVAAGSTISAGGTVTSVALTMPGEFSVSGSPVTTAGTLAVTKANESANTVWAGPTTGAAAQPTFRLVVNADLPDTGVVAGSYGDGQDIPIITVNSKGVLTAVSSVEIISAAFPVDKWWGHIRITDNVSQTVSTGVQALNMVITTSSFGASVTQVNDASHGYYLEYTAGTTATSRAGFFSNALVTRLDNLPLFYASTRTSASALTLQRIWIGLTSNNSGSTSVGMGTDTPGANSVHCIAFRASSVAGDTNWQIVSSDGSSTNVKDTGVAFATNTAYRFRIDAANKTSVHCYINGTEVNNSPVTTNLPSTTQNLALTAASYNTTSTAEKFGVKSIDIYEQIK